MLERAQLKDKIEPCEQGFINYIGAIVLGMNDALVELTGALAGFAMILDTNRLIALAGFTTGVAATLSMAAAEFLAKKADCDGKRPWAAALATGIAYLITVILLLAPFIILSEPMPALALCLFIAALIITLFTWTVSRIRGTSFVRDCVRMLGVSFGVAAIAFAISWAAKTWLGIET